MRIMDIAKQIGVKLQRINYNYEVLPLTKRKSGVQFKSYNLASAGDQVLFAELKSHSDEGDVIYDIGAHRGHWAIPLASAGRRVIAFEPNPIAYSQLQANNQASGVEVEVFNVGISDMKGRMTFYHSSAQTESSFYESNAKRSGEVVDTTEIDISTLDRLYTEYELPQPDHIKIDAEGMGPEIVRGGLKLIKQHSPALYIELHLDSNGASQEDETESLVKNLGYEISVLTEGALGYDGGHPWVCSVEQ